MFCVSHGHMIISTRPVLPSAPPGFNTSAWPGQGLYCAQSSSSPTSVTMVVAGQGCSLTFHSFSMGLASFQRKPIFEPGVWPCFCWPPCRFMKLVPWKSSNSGYVDDRTVVYNSTAITASCTLIPTSPRTRFNLGLYTLYQNHKPGQTQRGQ